MADITEMPVLEKSGWGVCPMCWRAAGPYNVEMAHFLVCHEHKYTWYIGLNKLPWSHENWDIWEANRQMLLEYLPIKPQRKYYRWPSDDRAPPEIRYETEQESFKGEAVVPPACNDN